MQIFLRVIIGAGALMGVLAGVHPQEAQSNLAAWFELFPGVKSAPMWLTPAVDTVVLWIGILLIVGGLAAILISKGRETKGVSQSDAGSGAQQAVVNSPKANVTQNIGSQQRRLTAVQCNEMTQKLRILRDTITELERTRCKNAEVRSQAIAVQRDTENWLKHTIGELSAERFAGAPQGIYGIHGAPEKYMGFYQKLVGQLAYLNRESTRVCD